MPRSNVVLYSHHPEGSSYHVDGNKCIGVLAENSALWRGEVQALRVKGILQKWGTFPRARGVGKMLGHLVSFPYRGSGKEEGAWIYGAPSVGHTDQRPGHNIKA